MAPRDTTTYPWRSYLAQSPISAPVRDTDPAVAKTDVAILVPKAVTRDPELVVSQAALQRRRMLLNARPSADQPAPDRLRVWQPKNNPAELFLSSGLRQRAPNEDRRQVPTQGAFEVLPNLQSF